MNDGTEATVTIIPSSQICLISAMCWLLIFETKGKKQVAAFFISFPGAPKFSPNSAPDSF